MRRPREKNFVTNFVYTWRNLSLCVYWPSPQLACRSSLLKDFTKSQLHLDVDIDASTPLQHARVSPSCDLIGRRGRPGSITSCSSPDADSSPPQTGAGRHAAETPVSPCTWDGKRQSVLEWPLDQIIMRWEVASVIPDRGTIVGWVFSPTRQLVRFSHLNVPFFLNSECIRNIVLVRKQSLQAICAFPLWGIQPFFAVMPTAKI